MQRKSFESMQCGIAQSLELVGDWWTLLIVREAMFGTCRFEEFCENLGIARNTLTDRLEKLLNANILMRKPDPTDRRRNLYELTEAGQELHVVLAALWQWGNRWVYGANNAPSFIVEAETGDPVAPIHIQSRDGRKLALPDLAMAPGKSAKSLLRRRIENANKRRKERISALATERGQS